MSIKETSKAERKSYARDELIYHLTEDLLVLLESKGKTKSELARALGKSRSFVTQVLSGQRNMTLSTLSDICFELGVKPEVTVLPNGYKFFKYETADWVASSYQYQSAPSNIISLKDLRSGGEYKPLKTAVA